MIFLLTLGLLVMLLCVYIFNKQSFYSVTLVTNLSFLIAALMYCFTYNIIGQDITLKTVIAILGTIIVMLIGELFGKSLVINESNSYKVKKKDGNIYYDASIKKMVIIFIFMIIIFGIRFWDLYRYSLTVGNSGGLLGTIASVRLFYATGQYTSEGIAMKIAIIVTLICEIYSYLYLYYFLYDLIVAKVVRKRMLLPFFGYLIICISFTGRNQYILCTVMIIWMIVYLYYSFYSRRKGVNRKLLRTLFRIGIIALVLLFAYAYITRNSSGEDSKIAKTLCAYFSAPLYGLDQTMEGMFYGIDGTKECFGYYTLQGIHSFLNSLGADISVPSFHNLPFFYYKNGSSNIYTSLLFPILDYGIIGMLITRFLIGIGCGIIENKVRKLDSTKKENVAWIIFMGILFYDAFNAYIGDRYYDDILTPSTLVKYTLFAYLVIKYFGKCKIYEVKEKGKRTLE